MGSRKLIDGFKTIGFAYGFGSDRIPANVEVHDGKVKLILIEIGDDLESFFSSQSAPLPDVVQFISSDIRLNLSSLSLIREKSELLTNLRTKIYDCGRVIRTSSDINHNQIHGMSSELEGFDRWAEQYAISQHLDIKDSPQTTYTYIMKAQIKEPILLGSSFNVEIGSGFIAPSPTEYSTKYTIHNLAKLHTETDDLKPWEEHRQVHQMIQDLLCLAYGYPCTLQIKEILRRDNQDFLPDSGDSNGKFYWHEAFDYSFGRTRRFEPRKDIGTIEPLFKLSDTSTPAIGEWIDNFSKWSRPTWVAVESIFQPHLAAESRMLLLGSAMEALGYAIWLYDENDGNSDSCGALRCKGERAGCLKPGCNRPNAVGYFKRVAKSLPWEDLKISSDLSVEAWAIEFNRVYKGCKHADNPLPGGLEANKRAREGLLVMRCWLAKKLGVSNEILIKNTQLT